MRYINTQLELNIVGKLAQKLAGQSQSQIQNKAAKSSKPMKSGGVVCEKACGGMVKKGKK